MAVRDTCTSCGEQMELATEDEMPGDARDPSGATAPGYVPLTYECQNPTCPQGPGAK